MRYEDITEIVMITCFRCHIEKGIEEFSKDRTTRSGYKGVCKACLREYCKQHPPSSWPKYEEYKIKKQVSARAYYQRNKEMCAAKRALWYKAHADEINERARMQHQANPERIRQVKLAKYSLTLESWDALYQKQGGVCAICGNPEIDIDSRTKAARRLSVDHNHVTGKVRGLLCNNCNKGIGNLQEDIEILLRAITYIKEDGIEME